MSLLLSICGLFVAFAGLADNNNVMVWIGATIAIISLIVGKNDDE